MKVDTKNNAIWVSFKISNCLVMREKGIQNRRYRFITTTKTQTIIETEKKAIEYRSVYCSPNQMVLKVFFSPQKKRRKHQCVNTCDLHFIYTRCHLSYIRIECRSFLLGISSSFKYARHMTRFHMATLIQFM